MAEYIEREMLIDWAKEFYPNDKHFVSGVMNAPTADVVEVVRCKECKFRYTKECPQFILPLDDNGFCSYGERKE